MDTTSYDNPSTDLILTTKYGSTENNIHLKTKHAEQKKVTNMI